MSVDPTLVLLNREWRQLAAASAESVHAWGEKWPVLADAVDLDGVLAQVRADSDAVLGALLMLGGAGDSLAWRTVLQSMLGKVVMLAGRQGRIGEAVSELWVVIGEYQVRRRPRSIAINLGWMLRNRLAEPALLALPAPVAELSGADILGQAHDLGLIDVEILRTLQLVYLEGLTSAKAADLLGISPEMVRYRCSRNLRRLAGQAQLLAG